MPVPSAISDLSTTPALNSPAGSESPALVDDYLRTHAAFIKQVNDESVKTSGNQTIAGTKTFSSPIAGSTTTQVSLTGNETIAGTKTFSSAPVVPGLNGGQLAGMRNKIINGKMEIAQRGTSVTGIPGGGYGGDRWLWNTAGVSSALNWAQQADAPSSNEFQFSTRFTVTTADTSIGAAEFARVEQRIEGYNVRDLIGRAFTLSFWVRSSKTGIHCVSFVNSGGDRSYVAEYTVSAANTWEYKTVTVSGGLITAGTWDWTTGIGLRVHFTLAAGSNAQTTAGAWQTGNFVATANQVNCLDTIGNIFAITGVQLEVGSVATPFEHRPYGAELALCQRYAYATDGSCSQGGLAPSTTQGYQRFVFPVPMRTAPTVSVTSAGSWLISNDVSADFTAATVSIGAANLSSQGARLRLDGFSGLTSGAFYGGLFSVGTAKLTFAAEL